MSYIRLTLTLIIAAIGSTAGAQTSAVSDTTGIVGHITADGVNTIQQPEALARLLNNSAVPHRETVQQDEETTSTESNNTSATPAHTRIAGYRVQVFSDNNASTARNEARAKSRNISERFPEMRTYVSYTSPYWRLKVGDFRTKREADDAAEEIRRAFPSYAKEIRVVRDRINLTN